MQVTFSKHFLHSHASGPRSCWSPVFHALEAALRLPLYSRPGHPASQPDKIATAFSVLCASLNAHFSSVRPSVCRQAFGILWSADRTWLICCVLTTLAPTAIATRLSEWDLMQKDLSRQESPPREVLQQPAHLLYAICGAQKGCQVFEDRLDEAYLDLLTSLAARANIHVWLPHSEADGAATPINQSCSTLFLGTSLSP